MNQAQRFSPMWEYDPRPWQRILQMLERCPTFRALLPPPPKRRPRLTTKDCRLVWFVMEANEDQWLQSHEVRAQIGVTLQHSSTCSAVLARFWRQGYLERCGEFKEYRYRYTNGNTNVSSDDS